MHLKGHKYFFFPKLYISAIYLNKKRRYYQFMKKNRASTPCLGICSTTYGDNVCKGCKRFVHEVISWNKYTTKERELINLRLESFKVKILADRFTVHDPALLASKLENNGIIFNQSLDPLTWIFDLLRATGSQKIDLNDFGISLKIDARLSDLRQMITKEFLELSESHYDRYFKTSS